MIYKFYFYFSNRIKLYEIENTLIYIDSYRIKRS